MTVATELTIQSHPIIYIFGVILTFFVAIGIAHVNNIIDKDDPTLAILMGILGLVAGLMWPFVVCAGVGVGGIYGGTRFVQWIVDKTATVIKPVKKSPQPVESVPNPYLMAAEIEIENILGNQKPEPPPLKIIREGEIIKPAYHGNEYF